MKQTCIRFLLISIVLFQSACAWFPSIKEPKYTMVDTWGKKGENNGQFNEPTGIAIYQNRVYVSDSRNSRIQAFDFNGKFLFSFGQQGEKELRLKRPMNMTVANEKIYVVDYFSDQVKVYNLDGSLVHNIGKPGKLGGEFNSPVGVAVAKNGDLYVADFYNQRIQYLNSKGEFLTQWGITGEVGTFSGKLNYPTDVALDKDENLYIADGYNDRVLVIDKHGALKHKWGGPFASNIKGSLNGWFTTVTGITIGPKGNVFVADFYNDRVQKFSTNGTFLNTFGVTSSSESHTAIAVAIADDGTVFVADYANNRIQKWQQNE